MFRQITAKKRDPEIEKSNASHKKFIDVLTEAFSSLRGEEWLAREKTAASSNEEEDMEDVVFSNVFSTLNVAGQNEAEGGDEDEDSDHGPKPGQGMLYNISFTCPLPSHFLDCRSFIPEQNALKKSNIAKFLAIVEFSIARNPAILILS